MPMHRIEKLRDNYEYPAVRYDEREQAANELPVSGDSMSHGFRLECDLSL
jgi:hypothetical protein